MFKVSNVLQYLFVMGISLDFTEPHWIKPYWEDQLLTSQFAPLSFYHNAMKIDNSPGKVELMDVEEEPHINRCPFYNVNHQCGWPKAEEDATNIYRKILAFQ